MVDFGQIFATFTPAVGSMTTFLLEIMESRYAFFVKHKKIYIGILAIFGNFWANICHVHSTCCLSCCIFAWDHCGQIFSFKITQKNCASSEMWWKFLPTTNKNSQIWGKCGISRQILDKLCMINNNINLLISTKRQFNWQVSDIFHFMKQICSSFWVMLF